ncbi:MAG: hypothetical protein ACLUFN_08315 [Eubacterium sp.]
MDFLKQWTLCVCITLVISVIFSLFTPKGRMAGFYKIILSLFIFISFLYPLKSFSIVDFKSDNVFSEFEYENAEETAYETMINNQVKSVLTDKNIIGAVVSSDVKIKNDEAVINSVQVAVPDEYETDTVQKVIFNTLGINAKVIYNGK